MQAERLQLAAEMGVRLVLSVDTGIRAFRAAEEAKRLGLDLIVTDHHLPDEAGVPDALAVLNPNQIGCPLPIQGTLRGGGGVQAGACAAPGRGGDRDAAGVRRAAAGALVFEACGSRDGGGCGSADGRKIGRWPHWDYASWRGRCSRVCGHCWRWRECPGIAHPRRPRLDFGWVRGLMRPGRMDVASDVVELLLTRDAGRARTLAEKLDRLNEERRATEREALGRIDEELEQQRLADGKWPAECLVLHDAGWHRGVLGDLGFPGGGSNRAAGVGDEPRGWGKRMDRGGR